MALRQEVVLQVHDEKGKLVLDASGLRVDFDIRFIPEFNRATFKIFNLSDSSIVAIRDGKKYVTLKVRLGDGKLETLANKYFLSNLTDILQLPDRITTLFCFDSLRNEVLEKPVNTVVYSPTLRNLVQRTIEATGYKGETTFENFPFTTDVRGGRQDSIIRIIDEPLQERKRALSYKSAQQCLRVLEKEFDFRTYTKDDRLAIVYIPRDIGKGEGGGGEAVTRRPPQFDSEEIVLDVRAMRSNPRIGIAEAHIDSNLDPSIKPGSVMDFSKLITIESNAEADTLEIVADFQSTYRNNSKYQAFSVQHKGSNYTDSWNTIVTGLSPTKGKLMPTVGWAGKTH